MHRIVTRDEAQRLIKKGWKAVDLHVHSSHSYDVMPVPELDPPALYEKAKQRGMGFVVFTGHDEMDAFEHFSRPDLVTGVEIKILDKRIGHTVHTNVFCLNKEQFLELEYIANEKQDVYEFAAYCRKHKLPFSLNHPFWAEPGEHCRYKAVEELVKLFPAIEINPGRVKHKNDLALKLAKRYNKPIVTGTDTHTGNIGAVYTLAQGKNFKEWWKNVESGKGAIVRGDLSVHFMLEEVNMHIHELFSPNLREAELSKMVKYKLGLRALDLLLRALIVARRYWIGRFVLKHVMLLISHTRLPAVIYLHVERRSGRKLQREADGS